MTVYLDGDEVSSVPGQPPVDLQAGTEVTIGNDHKFERPFLGTLDNVRIWQVALDPIEICEAAGRDDC